MGNLEQLTAEEMAEFRAYQAKKAAEEKEKQQAQVYRELVDGAIRETVADAARLSEAITASKMAIMERFRSVIELKEELYRGKKVLKDGRFSDTFTSSEGDERVSIGYHTTDNYADTHTEGMRMVREYIESLATDENSKQLAGMVDALLQERGKNGQLKAQNVLRLEKMANESGNEKFIKGMQIIRDAYEPNVTKMYVRVERKDENGAWMPIPLAMTNC